jgi:hypothetical protein
MSVVLEPSDALVFKGTPRLASWSPTVAGVWSCLGCSSWCGGAMLDEPRGLGRFLSWNGAATSTPPSADATSPFGPRSHGNKRPGALSDNLKILLAWAGNCGILAQTHCALSLLGAQRTCGFGKQLGSRRAVKGALCLGSAARLLAILLLTTLWIPFHSFACSQASTAAVLKQRLC